MAGFMKKGPQMKPMRPMSAPYPHGMGNGFGRPMMNGGMNGGGMNVDMDYSSYKDKVGAKSHGFGRHGAGLTNGGRQALGAGIYIFHRMFLL